jgi:hypothetical protein
MPRRKANDLPPIERFEIAAYRCDGGARGRRYMPPGPPVANRPLIIIDEAGVPRRALTFGFLGPPLGPPGPATPLEHVPGCHHLNPPPAKPDAAPTPLEADPTPDLPVPSDSVVSLENDPDAAPPPPEPAIPPSSAAPRPQVVSSAPDAEPEHVFEPELGDPFYTDGELLA